MRRFAALMIASFAFSVAAWCQTSTGTLRGSVTDSEGRPIRGATVVVSSSALIGGNLTTTTNASGLFRFVSLPVGVYLVQTRLEGFENTAVKTQMNLGSNVNLTLRLRYVKSESVTVEGDTSLTDTRSPGTSTIYKEEMLRNLPLQRNMWVLVQVAPGMTADYGGGKDAGTIAFGSNRQSNSWRVDGLDVTGPETGMAWWYTNPDIVEQIQVYGIGAPAEYGNQTGALINVITKKGSNNLHGAANYYFQTDELTDQNVRPANSRFGFHRDRYADITATLGGPIAKDKLWFFGGVEVLHDGATQPGSDPKFVSPDTSEKYDFKITTRLNEIHELNTFVHHESYDLGTGYEPSAYIEPSAAAHEFGVNWAWGANVTSAFSANLLSDIRYAAWRTHDILGSQTGSLEDPHQDLTLFPTVFSGGLFVTWDHTTYRHQANAKITYYADHFLRGQHEFKFGAQYSHGSADTIYGLGANGAYTYTYSYGPNEYFVQVYQTPFHYGGISKELAFFLDDTLTVTDRLSLTLGIRYDHNRGSFPDYERLEVGTPSITEIGNYRLTGEIISGFPNYVTWDLFSPRMGFTWQTHPNGKAALHGSFGVYYDHNVIGNWERPTPDPPAIEAFFVDRQTGDRFPSWKLTFQEPSESQKIQAPRSLQYSIGYDHQFNDSTSAGLQYVHKHTRDLVGWQILGGTYESVPFTDPFTGAQYSLLNIIEPPTLQKGNDPGDFPDSEGLRYFQKYEGVLFTLSKRFSNSWALNASYTWSKSYGLLPRMLSPYQCFAFYGSQEGNDPNNFINATGRLQGDRPHMVRAQLLFLDLPWNLQSSAAIEFSSGRPYTRQIRIRGLNQGGVAVIMQRSGLQHSTIHSVDAAIGKTFLIRGRYALRVDAQILNLLNSDQELSFATLELLNPDQSFIPSAWVQPRRLQVRLGFSF